MRRAPIVVLVLGLALALLWLVVEPRLDPDTRPVDVVVTPDGEVVAEPPGAREGDVHRRVFEEKMAWALGEGLDSLPLGEAVARLGRTFVGATYTPGTLDPEGPERLVVNLTELDCVTLVESVLAMARVLRNGEPDFDAFRRELARIRYRGGEMEGYPSRLHYFSEWIRDNEQKGIVRDLTAELGGVVEPDPIDFMTEHRDAYWQLADDGVFRAIGAIEDRLNRLERRRVPQERIAEVAPRIRNGDVIAATSSLQGLDVAHTGFALWVEGRLHLLHAPLVGKTVEISELPLADRILGIDAQDGIMVARPL